MNQKISTSHEQSDTQSLGNKDSIERSDCSQSIDEKDVEIVISNREGGYCAAIVSLMATKQISIRAVIPERIIRLSKEQDDVEGRKKLLARIQHQEKVSGRAFNIPHELKAAGDYFEDIVSHNKFTVDDDNNTNSEDDNIDVGESNDNDSRDSAIGGISDENKDITIGNKTLASEDLQEDVFKCSSSVEGKFKTFDKYGCLRWLVHNHKEEEGNNYIQEDRRELERIVPGGGGDFFVNLFLGDR